ncbi:MAG: histidine phosphatase family protein [Nocardioides sp.]
MVEEGARSSSPVVEEGARSSSPVVEEGALRPSRNQPRTLVLVRHGRTAWNLAWRAQGQSDIPLDDVGRAQARATASALGPRHRPGCGPAI